ncbi:FAD-dependent thiol oxidase [Athelia psychrophila]|uniref:Sulfhydryl oxidase n=1 Tax=Athelia psychrophila TaxID=1759441 RepID=A0A166THY9_9AGAM|nr:FAD-dependent thiol oxidase [Fibularhizoctonia sp. CBS 109695]
MADANTLSTTKTKPTPGMVLGPDGKPCKPCTAFRNWKPPGSGSKKAAAGAGAKSTAAMMAALASGQDAAPPADPRADCPADVEQLGRATWTFLHTTAAYYPDRPSQAQQSSMLGLINALPALYPCSDCASHLGGNMKEHPPDVSGRSAFSRWLCERHNDVNVRLGKDRFDCGKTDERWKDGPADGRCD